MATLTNDQLVALDLGYISGQDLMAWAPAQLLIKQYEVNFNSLQNGVDIAVSELRAQFRTRYNLDSEFEKDSGSTDRESLLVKLTSIFAIRNALGNLQNISESMLNCFMWADRTAKDVRNGQINLAVLQSNPSTLGSPGEVISDTFSTLG